MTLVSERLGYAPGDRVLVVNCDDLGSCHAANVGVARALADGIATSATLMTPCGWAFDAARRCAGHDLGVHLTLNAEHEGCRWRPLTESPSLVDPTGAFPRDPRAVWASAAPAEIRRELRAQIDAALGLGIEPTHLDSHMATLRVQLPFFELYIEAAAEYGLPVRMSGPSTTGRLGFEHRQIARVAGVLSTDHLVQLPSVGSRATFERVIGDLRPGVTELYAHPAADTPELRALAKDWKARTDDLRLLLDDALAAEIAAAGVALTSFAAIRDLQRA